MAATTHNPRPQDLSVSVGLRSTTVHVDQQDTLTFSALISLLGGPAPTLDGGQSPGWAAAPETLPVPAVTPTQRTQPVDGDKVGCAPGWPRGSTRTHVSVTTGGTPECPLRRYGQPQGRNRSACPLSGDGYCSVNSGSRQPQLHGAPRSTSR